MAQPYVMADQFTGDANAAIVEYSAAFATALEASPPTVTEQLSMRRDGASLITRWYIPLHAAGYTPFEGTLPFRELSEKFFDIKLEKWADGVKADADKVEDRDFGGFAMSPQVMANNARLFPDEKLADLINDGENIAGWDGADFLDASAHPVNAFEPGFGTYGNFNSNLDLDDTGVTTALNAMLARKGANGKSLALLGTHLLLPTALYETGRRLVELQRLSDGSENPLFGRLKAVHWPQLAQYRWAVLDNSKPDLKAFAVSMRDGGMPEMIEHGKDSALYKTSMEVGFNAVLRIGFALAMPQAIYVAVHTP
jgi:phage major head subunit gpT-like protein